jgi:hypothetical protein
MAEYEPPQKVREGHFPKTETALIELYRLVAIFLASENFAALRNGEPGEGHDPVYKLQECEEEEITRILLVLAITARVIDDREGRVYELVGTDCGTLQRNTSRPATESLTLREACNKIIHAKKVRLDMEEDHNRQRYLNPYIYIYGNQAEIEWKATVDVVLFAREYVTCVSGF